MTNFLKKFKLWILGFLGVGVALAAGLPAIVPSKVTPSIPTESEIVSDIQAKQSKHKLSNGKYLQEKEKTKGNITSRTDVYDGPNGVGYRTTLIKRKGKKVYKKVIGKGAETKTHGWIDITPKKINKTSTSTKQ